MKRDALAIIIHPYKNVLVPPDKLRESINLFAERILEIAETYVSLRLNLLLPAYLLHYTDPLLLSRLRELQKRDALEWLSSGYTEPFLSFSPHWLSGANIQHGNDTFEEMVAYRPCGYAPPFSNWEPSAIDTLRECGMQYILLSRALLPSEVQEHCGYWITEQAGSTMTVFPTHILHHYTAPANVKDWIEGHTSADTDDSEGAKLVSLEYVVPLVQEKGMDPYQWLRGLAEASESLLLKYRIIRLHEFLGFAPPRGLQYIPPTLAIRRDDKQVIPYFSNFLHTYEQVGLIQRKVMDIAERLKPTKDSKDSLPLLRNLFSAQDINRYLPTRSSGFPHLNDRLWAYNKLIDLERQLHKRDKIKGGQIRIADFLRNGTKCIVLSNKSLKVYLDHKNGGQVFELDYRDKGVNLCAGYHPQPHNPPRIIAAEKSRTGFIDHILDENCGKGDFLADMGMRGDFAHGQFDYKIKKSSSGAKAILSRQGRVQIEDKYYPLFIEKVFGLEDDEPALSFVYQLSNHSLTEYSFRIAIESVFSLPGVATKEARVTCDGKQHTPLLAENLSFTDVTSWAVSDPLIGTEMEFSLQKPVDVWILPSIVQTDGTHENQGITLVISSKVALGENSVWSLIGKITCKKTKTKGDLFDAV